MDEVQAHDARVFLGAPLLLVYVWVQVVVPALAALLADAAGEALGDLGPVAWAILSDNFHEDSVFVLGPGARDTVIYVVQLEPADVALDLGLAGHQLANPVPGVAAELIDPHLKMLILIKKKVRLTAERYGYNAQLTS